MKSPSNPHDGYSDRISNPILDSSRSQSPQSQVSVIHDQKSECSTVQVTEPQINLQSESEQLKKEICNLYLKIKRCSKDTQITESQYVKHLENSEDR